ncbi:MAG: hypothetical protein U1E31_01040 [Rickettsiales bacterium]
MKKQIESNITFNNLEKDDNLLKINNVKSFNVKNYINLINIILNIFSILYNEYEKYLFNLYDNIKTLGFDQLVSSKIINFNIKEIFHNICNNVNTDTDIIIYFLSHLTYANKDNIKIIDKIIDHYAFLQASSSSLEKFNDLKSIKKTLIYLIDELNKNLINFSTDETKIKDMEHESFLYCAIILDIDQALIDQVLLSQERKCTHIDKASIYFLTKYSQLKSSQQKNDLLEDDKEKNISLEEYDTKKDISTSIGGNVQLKSNQQKNDLLEDDKEKNISLEEYDTKKDVSTSIEVDVFNDTLLYAGQEKLVHYH